MDEMEQRLCQIYTNKKFGDIYTSVIMILLKPEQNECQHVFKVLDYKLYNWHTLC